MADLVVDRAVVADLAWHVRERRPLPPHVVRTDRRLFYEPDGMSALEHVLFSHETLAPRLVAVRDRGATPRND